MRMLGRNRCQLWWIIFQLNTLDSEHKILKKQTLQKAEGQDNIIYMEELENDRDFSNTTHLVTYTVESARKQVFISTHCSYLANKRDIGNVIPVKSGAVYHYCTFHDYKKILF